jgi:hypothetical protein
MWPGVGSNRKENGRVKPQLAELIAKVIVQAQRKTAQCLQSRELKWSSRQKKIGLCLFMLTCSVYLLGVLGKALFGVTHEKQAIEILRNKPPDIPPVITIPKDSLQNTR